MEYYTEYCLAASCLPREKLKFCDEAHFQSRGISFAAVATTCDVVMPHCPVPVSVSVVDWEPATALCNRLASNASQRTKRSTNRGGERLLFNRVLHVYDRTLLPFFVFASPLRALSHRSAAGDVASW